MTALSRRSPEAERLRSNAEAVTGTYALCEQTCLHVGGRLGDAIPGLSDLAGLFETLPQTINGADFRDAGQNLQEVAREIATMGHALAGEIDALTRLVAANAVIGAHIGNLSANMRTISALVFNVKIEVASLQGGGENMTDFADNLQRLATRVQRALEEYQTKHTRLCDILQASCNAQTSFQKQHQTKLLTISADIDKSLEAIAARRKEITASLADIGAQSLNIGMQIGQGVVALQVGDSTRQRIEHAHIALHLAADGIAAPAGTDEARMIAARICRLQALQVKAAVDDFSRETNTIAFSLQGLADDAGGLASRGRKLFGSDAKGRDSFLEELESKLAAAHHIIDECRAARVVVDKATQAVGVTMADLETRAANLSEIVVDMTVIGMNAILKSSRLGQRGRGLNVIAQELRTYANNVILGIKGLPSALHKVIASADVFAETQRAHNADRMTALAGSMTAAIAVFNASGAQLADALTRLDGEAEGVRNLLKDAADRLGSRKDISATLLDAVAALDTLAGDIGDARDPEGRSAAIINDLLRAHYTMACERQIHDAFVGQSDDGPLLDFAALEPESAGSADADLEALLF